VIKANLQKGIRWPSLLRSQLRTKITQQWDNFMFNRGVASIENPSETALAI
jgi:hypothetical protein